jgi:hypothetical protein
MPQQVALYSAEASSSVGCIVFSDPRWVPEYGCRCTFVCDGDEWTVDLTMIPPYQYDMLGFFEELARGSAGWADVRSWASEDQEVEIEARNDGQLVSLHVTMAWPSDWEPRRLGSIAVEPAELQPVAEQMKRFIGLERGERFRRI